ncbi:hypothetical protein Plhal703r1_c01g0007431 [Plasmopara halstedii]
MKGQTPAHARPTWLICTYRNQRGTLVARRVCSQREFALLEPSKLDGARMSTSTREVLIDFEVL